MVANYLMGDSNWGFSHTVPPGLCDSATAEFFTEYGKLRRI